VSDPDLEQLYTLPLTEFTAARDALAKRLRSESDRAQAEEVKKLRKPSATAWALNQVRRSDPHAVDALLAAGQRLRDAQEGLLAGGERDELAAAVAEERRLVSEVAELAARRLESGASAAARTKLTATLRAVATDVEARALLQSGTLTRDYESSDFGLSGMAFAPSPPAVSRERAQPPQRPTVADGRLKQARERLERARFDERSAREALQEAERGAVEARREAERAAAALAEADRALGRAERALQQAAAIKASSGERVAELEALVLDLEGG
jgi:hypothetical protein